MNLVKRVYAALMITFFLLVIFVPIILPSGAVLAQTQSTGYTITSIDHTIEVMYTGQTVIRDTIYVSGQISDVFTIGFPSNFSAYVIKGFAYDDQNVYQLNLGVQLGNRSGFYGAEVNFNGHTPSVFTVAFVLSTSILNYIPDSNDYTLNYPAYPSLTQTVGSCNVSLSLPSTPASISISKGDGDVSTNSYTIQNLAPYTYETASAAFQLATGTLELADISQLNRQITIDPSGQVTSSDKYYITNNATILTSTPSTTTGPSEITSFVVGVPPTATNIVVTDSFGRTLPTQMAGTVSYGSDTSPDILLENATLVAYLTAGESTVITATYNLPSAIIQGSTYTLNNLTLFPDFYYFVDQASCMIVPPEGATIVSPQASSLDSADIDEIFLPRHPNDNKR